MPTGLKRFYGAGDVHSLTFSCAQRRPDLHTPEATLRTGGGFFWQVRFCDFKVRTEKKKVEKLKYMHRKPVTRGL